MSILKNDNSKNYQNLEVWKKSMTLSDHVYEIIVNFPDYEKFAMKTQIIRSCTSISANIAEVNVQYSLKRELFHLNTSIGSAPETQNWLIHANRRNYINKEKFDKLNSEIIEIIKMLYGYRKQILGFIECGEE